MPRPLQHLGISNVVRKLCFMRMNSYTRPDSRILWLAVVFFRQFYTAVGRVGSVTVAYGKVGFDPVLFRARQHFFTIGVVAIAFEVGVGVDEHGRWSLVVSRSRDRVGTGASRVQAEDRQRYFNLVPTGTSSRKLASTGLPPSGDAATIMPFDSSPRSFRGARLATTTTFRPINDSGSYASAIPATSCRTSVPRSTSRRNSLSAPLTRSALLTCATRSSIFAKSSMLILPSGIAAAGFAPTGGSALTAACVAGELAAGATASGAPPSFCSSILCILSTADLSARGNTACTSPSFVPRCSCPHCKVDKSNLLMSPKPSCVQIFAVAFGITGCASAVTMRSASALV